MCMERSIDISFSDQAELLIDETDYSKEDVVDFLVEGGGFTVGGNDVVSFLENR